MLRVTQPYTIKRTRATARRQRGSRTIRGESGTGDAPPAPARDGGPGGSAGGSVTR